MNSKVLVTIIIIISATLGFYIGFKQVASQKNDIIISSNNIDIENSGDLINNASGEIVSGNIDVLTSGETSVSGNTSTNPIRNTNKIDMPSNLKSIYITGWGIGTKNIRESVIKAIKDYGYNAIVIDIKDESGQLSYNSKVQTAIDIGASKNMIKDINAVIEELHENGIYVIGRIVTFKDRIYAGSIKTTVAYKKADGTTWKDYSGYAWPNPYNKNSWEYPIALAKEAAEIGFDEIQFDYVRFPSSEGKTSQIAYGFDSATKTKSDTINAFLTEVMKEMKSYDVVISADVFGITTKRNGDFENIGQDFAKIAGIVDVICPMVYPSHYANNEYKIQNPDLEPYKIVYNALKDAKERLQIYSGDSSAHVAKIRPYLQDFTASWLGKGKYITYSTEQVADQIKACYELGFMDFTLWDPSNKYCYDAVNKVQINTNTVSSGENTL